MKDLLGFYYWLATLILLLIRENDAFSPLLQYYSLSNSQAVTLLGQHREHYHSFLRSFSPSPSRIRLYGSPNHNVESNNNNNNKNTSESRAVVDELSDERKATLFQFLLRDLEVEGVPVLGCDANEPTTFQAATWTTIAELNENHIENKVCLVFENVAIDNLMKFTTKFNQIKTTTKQTVGNASLLLPELQRISIDLVGKGVGPALIISTTNNRTSEEIEIYDKRKQSTLTPDETKWTAAMKTFLARMVSGLNIPPHTSDSNIVDPIAYRIIGSSDVCDILSGYWTCICELSSQPEEQMSSIVVSYPPIVDDTEQDKHNRYTAIADLFTEMFLLFNTDKVYALVHLQPYYDRDEIHPKDKPIHGHLPSSTCLKKLDINISEEDFKIQNYQRRSPLPGVIIERVSLIEAAANKEKGKDLGADLNRQTGIEHYIENVKNLAAQGEEKLANALSKEMELIE